MSLSYRSYRSVVLAVILVASFLAACSQQAQHVGSADPTVEATASPSATPEPTLEPADAFVEYLTESRFTATADLSGTLVINREPVEVIGEWTVSGADFHTALDFGAAGGRVEQAVVDGQNYVRQPSMPWKRDMESSISSDEDLGKVLAALSWQLADEGSAGVGDAGLVASGSRIETALALLGLVDRTVGVDDGTLTVRVDNRGVPTEIRVEADVHSLEGKPVSIQWELVYALHDVGRRTTVKKPEIWVPHESGLGYSMQHPESWSVTLEPATPEFLSYDLYLSPISGEVHVTLFDGIDPGAPANSWLQEAAAGFSDWAGTPEEVEPLTVAGAPALFLGTHGSDTNGEWWIMQVSIVGDGQAWDVQFWSPPGTEMKARETLDQFLATFQMAKD